MRGAVNERMGPDLTEPKYDPSSRLRCLSFAAAAALAVFAWQFAYVNVIYGGNWTSLFMVGAQFPPPAEVAAETFVFPHSGYDGQFYRHIAHDLFFQKGYSKGFDDARFRCRRILVPAAAYLLAAGNKGWIDSSYIFVIDLSIFLGTYWCGRFLTANGRNAAGSLLFLLMPATLTSLDRMVVDVTLTALFAGFMAYSDRGSPVKLYLVVTLAALTRETGMFLVAAPVAAFVWQREWRKALWFATAALPTLSWYAFLSFHTPPSQAIQILSFPGIGLIQRIFTPRSFPLESAVKEIIFQAIDLAALVGFAASIVAGLRFALREGSKTVGIGVALFASLGLVLGSLSLIEAYAWARIVSPLLLYVALRCYTSQWYLGLAAPLAATVSVGLFFVSPFFRIVRSVFSFH